MHLFYFIIFKLSIIKYKSSHSTNRLSEKVSIKNKKAPTADIKTSVGAKYLYAVFVTRYSSGSVFKVLIYKEFKTQKTSEKRNITRKCSQ